MRTSTMNKLKTVTTGILIIFVLLALGTLDYYEQLVDNIEYCNDVADKVHPDYRNTCIGVD